MDTNTQIGNLALSHLGFGKEIASLTEKSSEAEAVNRVYDIARKYTLRAFAWPFANVFADLVLVETQPTDEWGFSYAKPDDSLRIIRILSGIRNDTRQSRVPFKIGNSGSDALLIYCDMESAQVEYTIDEDNPMLYPDDFVMALSYRIGYLIAPRITKGDPFKVGINCMQMFKATIMEAAANAVNEVQAEEDPDSEFIRIRS